MRAILDQVDELLVTLVFTPAASAGTVVKSSISPSAR